MDDFRPGKPGSEEARVQLEYYGLFLLDGDRSFDEQALEALKKAYKAKKDQFDEFIHRQRESGTISGQVVTPELLEEQKQKSGYGGLEKDLTQLKQRVDYLEKILGGKGHKGKVKDMIDPRLVCFGTSPPKVFASETALEMFLLDKSEEFKKQHYTLQKQMLAEK